MVSAIIEIIIGLVIWRWYLDGLQKEIKVRETL